MAAVLSVTPSPTAPKLSGLQSEVPPPPSQDASSTDNEASAVRRVNRSMNDRDHSAGDRRSAGSSGPRCEALTIGKAIGLLLARRKLLVLQMTNLSYDSIPAISHCTRVAMTSIELDSTRIATTVCTCGVKRSSQF